MWIIELLLRPSRQVKRGDTTLRSNLTEQARVNARDAEILKTMWTMIACGLGAVASGFQVGFSFGIWTIYSEEPYSAGVEILSYRGEFT